jgi:hypothetical protein
MLSRDDIIRMAREAGFTVVDSVDPQCWAGDHAADDESLERFFTLAYEAGVAAERERIIAANAPEIERINAHIKGMRDHMIADGWRQCAQGQKTTQFCAVAEQARLEEREACAQVCEARYMGDNNREDMEARRCAAAIRARSKE